MNNFVILIPSYNDWDSLSILIPKINHVIKKLKKNISIIIINDASSKEKELRLKEKLCFERIDVLNLLENVKAQKAIATALNYLKQKEYKGGIIIMDADGQDDPDALPEIIELSEKNPEKIITVNRTKRNESLMFKILYEIHLFITYMLTFKNLRFGVYSYMHPIHLNKILLNKDLCCAFAASIAKNFKHKNIIYSERKKRILGESKNSYWNLIYYSLSIWSVFKYKVVLHTSTMLLIFFILLDFKFYSVVSLIALAFFNVLIFSINHKNKKFDLTNSSKNIKNLENIIYGKTDIHSS